MQRLAAGSDWSNELKAGIDQADRLILVVSQAALESSYSGLEWHSHFESGKPLILVIYESVEQTEVLQGPPTLDFRTQYHEQAAQLATDLQGGEVTLADPVPRKNKLNITNSFPRDIWFNLLVVIGHFLSFFIGISQLIPRLFFQMTIF